MHTTNSIEAHGTLNNSSKKTFSQHKQETAYWKIVALQMKMELLCSEKLPVSTC